MQIPQITFTRFLACLAIVSLHFGYFSWPLTSSFLADFRDDLIAAMSYFFLLSGFILVVSQAKNETLPNEIHTIDFWKRRAARILPVYYLALLLFFFINFNYQPDTHIIWQLQPYAFSLLLLQSWKYTLAMDVNFPSWSLSVEAFFYFIFPFVYILIHKIKGAFLIPFAFVIWFLNILLLIYLKNLELHEHLLQFFPMLHLSTFVVGICSGFLFIHFLPWLQRTGKQIIFRLTLFVLFILLYTAHNNWQFHTFQQNGLLAPLYVLIIYSIALAEGKMKDLLSSKPLVFLGNISYAMYILQLPVYQLCDQHIPFINTLEKESLFLPFLAFLIGSSSLIHVYFEKPIRQLITK